MNTKESNHQKFKAMTCEELSKILSPFGDKIVYSGSWIVTGIRTRQDGNINLLCRNEDDVLLGKSQKSEPDTIVALPSRDELENR